MKGLHADIFRWSLGDCSAGGLSGRCKGVTVIGIPGGEIFEPSADAPAVRLVKRTVFGREYVHAEPIDPPKGCRMSGGTFVYTSDARFSAATGTMYPVGLHDRDEMFSGGGA